MGVIFHFSQAKPVIEQIERGQNLMSKARAQPSVKPSRIKKLQTEIVGSSKDIA
jgi:hypothetical protein